MQVTETLSDGLRRAYTLVVPAADIESRRASRLAELAKQVNLPGFRPGRVPLPIVRQRFGGAVAAEVLEQTINETTQRLLSERDLRPAVMPKLEMVTEEPTALGPAKDLEFKVELELLPEITLPNFADLHLTRLVAKVPAEQVDQAVTDIAQRNRELVPLTEEELAARGDNPGAAGGDVLTVDFAGKIDGVPFPGGTMTDTDVDIGGSGFIPGFAESLEGMRSGETRTIDVTFPANYGGADLAGKAATFDVTAKQLRKPVIPEANDELAEKIGFESLENLRETLEQIRQRRLDGLTRARLKRELLDALAERATFTPPETLVNQEFDQIWKNLEQSRANGTMDEDDKAKTEDELRTEYRAIADRRVRLGLLLGEIGRSNQIVVTPEEVNAAIRAEASRYPGREAQMIEFYRNYPAAADALRGPIFEDKVVDYVIEAATVTDAPTTVEELERDPVETKASEAPAGTPESMEPPAAPPEATHAAAPDVSQFVAPEVTQAAAPEAAHAAAPGATQTDAPEGGAAEPPTGQE